MKPRIAIRLFGKFSLQGNEQELLTRASRGAKEILAYLAVHHGAAVSRETLAGLIAPEASQERSRKALRQALWNLRAALSAMDGTGAGDIVRAAEGWMELELKDIWLDAAEFERAAAQRTTGAHPFATPQEVRRLAQAVELYRGDLLEGWYQDWCLEERERLRQIFLESLDALISDCEARRDVSAGVAYGHRALAVDPARECTHGSLMRFYWMSGDRASAAHQYARCVEALRAELGIEPDDTTRALDRRIRTGHPFSDGDEERELPPALTLRPKREKP